MGGLERTTAILRLEERELATYRFPLSPPRHPFSRPHEWGYAKECEDAGYPFCFGCSDVGGLGEWKGGG